jgi:hypothetical protein
MTTLEAVTDWFWDWPVDDIGVFIGVAKAMIDNPSVGVSSDHGEDFLGLMKLFRALQSDDKRAALRKAEGRYQEKKAREPTKRT